MRNLIIVSALILGASTIRAQYVPELDVRGTHDATDGAEFQLATPTETNFLRFFSGMTGDRSPHLYFSNQDTFHIANGGADFSNFTEILSINGAGEVSISDLVGTGVRRVTVDGAGTLKASAPVGTYFSATLTEDSTLQNASFYTVINWSETNDDADNFDPITGIYTVAENGVYLFNMKCSWRRAAMDLDDVPIIMRFLVNGNTTDLSQKSERVIIRSSYGEDTSHSLTAKFFAGDEISIAVNAITGGPSILLGGLSATFISGTRID